MKQARKMFKMAPREEQASGGGGVVQASSPYRESVKKSAPSPEKFEVLVYPWSKLSEDADSRHQEVDSLLNGLHQSTETDPILVITIKPGIVPEPTELSWLANKGIFVFEDTAESRKKIEAMKKALSPQELDPIGAALAAVERGEAAEQPEHWVVDPHGYLVLSTPEAHPEQIVTNAENPYQGILDGLNKQSGMAHAVAR